MSIWVKCDRTRVWQVLTYLIGNAIKFTTKGGITIKVYQSDCQIYIDVTDTGVGISGDAQEKVFESFTQADTSTTRKFGGTGLGLTISKKLAILMGRDITVTSTLEEGSTFSVGLALKKAEEPKVTENVTSEGKIVEKLNRVKGLVADDNTVNQQVAKGMFKKLGIAIDIANDGKEAFDLAQETNYDIIFLDIQMPTMDGYTATKKIKMESLKNASTPIIAMTANAMQGDKEKCLEEGMDDYLSKPIQKDKLYNMVIRWKQRKRPANT